MYDLCNSYTYNRYKFEYLHSSTDHPRIIGIRVRIGKTCVFEFGSPAFEYGLQLEVVLRKSCSVAQDTILIRKHGSFTALHDIMRFDSDQIEGDSARTLVIHSMKSRVQELFHAFARQHQHNRGFITACDKETNEVVIYHIYRCQRRTISAHL